MKIRKDPKITVDDAMLKMVGEVVCTEIKDSIRKNQKIYARARQSENQYRQITQYEQMGKKCDKPWEGAADYFVPLTEWIVDAVHGRVMNVLFGIEGPYMTAEGTGPEDVERAPAITDFVDGVFRDVIKLQDNVGYFFKQMLKLPFAVLKYDWVNEFEPVVLKESAVEFIDSDGKEEYILPDDPEKDFKAAQLIANGYQPNPEMVDVWVKKDVETKDAAELKYIIFKDYIWDNNAGKGDKPFFEGDRTWITLNEMLNKANDGKFIKTEVDFIVNKTLEASGGGGVKEAVTMRSKPRECFNWYGRLPFNKQNQIDLTDRDTIEQEVRIIVDYATKRILYIGYWEYERMPSTDRVYIRDFYEESNGFDGRSLVDKLFKTQYELNDFKNTIMNNAWISMQKIFVKKKSADSDLDQPGVFPGAIWEETSTGDIRTLEVGDVKAVGIEIENSLVNYAERISNISQWSTGQGGKGGKTKGEVDSTIYEGNIGMNRFVGRCHNVLKKLCQWTAGYYYERMPDDLDKKIRGAGAEQATFPTKKEQADGQSKYWQPEDLEGWNKFNWIWNGTTLTSDKNRNIMISNDLQDRYLVHPMVGGNLMFTWEILKRGYQARGIRDWQKLLPKREDIIQEMERMSKESEQSKKPKAEEIAIKQLIEKGVPQADAIELVKSQVGGGNVKKLVAPAGPKEA